MKRKKWKGVERVMSNLEIIMIEEMMVEEKVKYKIKYEDEKKIEVIEKMKRKID